MRVLLRRAEHPNGKEKLQYHYLSSTAMPNAAQSKILCGPVYVVAVAKVSYILKTCPYFDNLEFKIFDLGGLQCHFIMFVTTAVRMRTLSVH